MKNNQECPLCGLQKNRIVYKELSKGLKEGVDQGYRISEGKLQKPEEVYQCDVCNFIFAGKDRSSTFYLKQYEDMIDEDYLKEEQGRREAARIIIKKIEKHKKRGKLLDIGCANGFFLDEARKRGWEVFGVEVSQWALDYAKEKLNLNVFKGPLKNASLKEGSFDVVVMMDVIEHLQEPRKQLEQIKKILKKDGILYISTPDISSFASRILRAKWWGINRAHLVYFSKETFQKMLTLCGFKISRYYSHVRIFSFSYWAKRISQYDMPGILKIFNFISKKSSFGKIKIKINLHDQIEAVAFKK
ncbi:MAG: class I SAM-dependent methyltransferase [Candidatus Omnitrophica bacterium]|nr:class I SAM-dependent methyltransferase [Candidatus Omnitrophota bacterium]